MILVLFCHCVHCVCVCFTGRLLSFCFAFKFCVVFQVLLVGFNQSLLLLLCPLLHTILLTITTSAIAATFLLCRWILLNGGWSFLALAFLLYTLLHLYGGLRGQKKTLGFPCVIIILRGWCFGRSYLFFLAIGPLR